MRKSGYGSVCRFADLEPEVRRSIKGLAAFFGESEKSYYRRIKEWGPDRIRELVPELAREARRLAKEEKAGHQSLHNALLKKRLGKSSRMKPIVSNLIQLSKEEWLERKQRIKRDFSL
jgi:hypothetical protein